VVAPDPVRYRDPVVLGPVGLPTHDGGLVLPSAFPWNFGTTSRSVLTVDNTGDVPVLPAVTVRGSADSVTVRGGPRVVSFGGFAGVLVFDSAQRRVFVNGADRTRDMVLRRWPVVPAGGVHEFTF